MYIDTKETFKIEFEDLCKMIITRFPNKEGQEREIAGYIVIKHLHDALHDASNLSFIEFYKKYLQNTMFFDCDDFTQSQKVEIIKEASLRDRDRKLAYMYFIDIKPEQEIADELGVDIRTVRNNIPKISQALKETSAKMYK